MNLFTSQKLVLAVHLTARGFGWVVFEGPEMPLDWGTAHAKSEREVRLPGRFRQLLSQYDFPVVVMEEFEARGTKRAERIRELYRTFVRTAEGMDVTTFVYRREAVAGCLGLPLTASRHSVSQAIVARLDAFSHRLPRKRGFGASEDPRQSLFDAAALALTHYALQSASLPPAHSGAPE